MLWSIATRTLKSRLIGHASAVSHVAFSKDGQMLISASYDGTIFLWDLTLEVDTITQVNARGVAPDDFVLAPAMLRPTQTLLLPNYPNPFNPETWIPYQLSAPADVTVRIYATSGALIRSLTIGYQPAGTYQNRSSAVYWDGKNEVGEPIASGVYFYTLSAGQFTMTRRMVIRK